MAVSLNQTSYYLKKIQTDESVKAAFGQSLTDTMYSNHVNPKDSINNVCRDTLSTIPVVIYTKKNFFLLDALNEKIMILKASGLIKYWRYPESLAINELKGPKVLMLSQLLGCFYILLIGVFISFVAFIGEAASDRFIN